MSAETPRFPNKYVVMGVFLVLAGGILLLWTAGLLVRFANLWSVAPLVAGLVLLYYRVFRAGPDYYVFLGTSLVLSGLLFLLTATALPVEMGRIWPLFLTIIGVALVAYGLRRSSPSRVTFTVPGIGMILLSGLFLPFSLELVSTDFAVFVRIWWPGLLVVAGLILVATHVGKRAGE